MRWLRIGAATLACAAAVHAQSSTGRWEARMYQVDEGRKMVLALIQQGGTLTGDMLQPNNPWVPILEGAVSGNAVRFAIERPCWARAEPQPRPLPCAPRTTPSCMAISSC